MFDILAPPPAPKEKWLLFFKIALINITVVTGLFLLSALITGPSPLFRTLKPYLNVHISFLYPISDLGKFFLTSSITIGAEEIQYRLLPWLCLLLLIMFIKLWESRNNELIGNEAGKFFYFLAWIPFIIGNYLWTLGHSDSLPILGPIFFVGLTWSWLVIRTREWQLAVLSHIFANTSIYFFIKILLLWGVKW